MFTLKIKELKETMANFKKIMMKKPESYIFDSIRIKAYDSKVGMTVFNKTTQIERVFENVETSDYEELVVGFAKLHKIIKKQKTGLITFERSGESNYKIKIKNISIELPCLSNNDEFEENDFMNKAKTMKASVYHIESNILKKALEKTFYTASRDEMKKELNGITYDFRTNRVISADSFRVSLYELPFHHVKNESENLEIDTGYSTFSGGVTPYDANEALFRILKKIKGNYMMKIIIDDTENGVMFNFYAGDYIITCIRTATPPDYDMVIPKSYNTQAFFEKKNVLDALEVLTPLTENETDIITIGLNGSMKIESKFTEFKAKSDDININKKGSNQVFKVDSVMLNEALKHFENDKIELDMVDSGSVIVLNEENYTHGLMPIKAAV